MDVARLNMSHGTHEDHERSLPAGARRPPTRAATASASSPTSRARRSGSRRSPTARSSSTKGQQWTITTRDVAGDAEICGTTYKGLPGDVHAGDPILIDDGKVRLRRRLRSTAPTCTPTVVVGGKVSDHKGINLPGVAVSVPGAVGEGHRGPALGAAPRRRLHRAVLRAQRRRRRGRAQGDGRGGRAASRSSPRSRSRRRSRTSTRSSRPSTASWSRAATSAWSARSRTCRSSRSGSSTRPAVNAKPVIVATQMLESMIANPAADPRRGLRRRQRRPRRRRRRDAVRRDQRRRVPDRDRRDDGPDHRVHRGPRPGAHGRASTWDPRDPRRRHRQGRRRGRRAHRARSTSSRSPRRGDSARRLSRLRGHDPGAGLHARRRRPARSWP